MASDSPRKRSHTAPKGRVTPGRASRAQSITFWQRYRVQIQWALIVLAIVATIVVIIVVSDPRPITNR